MKKSTLVIFSLFLTINIVAQDWYKQIADQAKLVDRIRSNEPWESIYQFAKKELNIPKESLTDISKTIEFLDEKKDQTVVDQFFHNICDSVFTNFPYRRSGHLSNDLYIPPTHDLSEIEIFITRTEGKSLYGEFPKLLQIDEDILLPHLQKYLQNDALTRLCIKPRDWGDVPYCLSISDVAMEIIEAKTYCDFFDNASQPEMLFSNLDTLAKDRINNNITYWHKETELLTTTEAIVCFLDKFTDLGHSYTYTCYNLKFLGDSNLAIVKLNERDTFLKCSLKLANYPFWDVDYEDCIKIMLERDNYLYKDRDLSSVVNGDIKRYSLATRTDYWDDWHILFTALVDYDKSDIPKALIALMQIKEKVNESEIPNKEKWEMQYPLQYNNNFRVCDFALLKYHELISPIEVNNWLDSSLRDKWIQKLATEYGD